VAQNIRVHQLARELGLANKDILDLCNALGIGVKSHSSSIQEAQADRIRRRAQREGLGKTAVATAEPEAPAAGKEGPSSAPAERPKPRVITSGRTSEPDGETRAPRPAPAARPAPTGERPAARSTTPPPAAPPAPPTRSTPSPARPAGERPAAAAAGTRPIPPPPGTRPSTAPGAPSGRPPAPPGSTAARPPAPPSASPRPPAPPRPAGDGRPPGAPPRPEGAPSGGPGGRPTPPPSPGSASSRAGSGRQIPPPPGAPPRSGSGRQIPPPPGAPPRSGSGRPIPPPPGGRPRTGGGPGGPRPGPRLGGYGPPGNRPGGPPGNRPGGPPFGRPGGGFPGRGGPGGPRRPRKSPGRRRRNREELQPQDIPTYTPEDAPIPEGEVVIERGATAKDVGPKLNRSAADVVRFLLQQGEMVTATQTLSDEMIELFAADIGAIVHLVDPGQEQEVGLLQMLDIEDDEEEDEGDLVPRSPVVTVMGHVDHGKTLLLDRIRSTNVVEGEAGGITQHIGAYQVERGGKLITFIDTPGHEAFTAMRARGAEVTDIVILVVAADDGVMPTTLEALAHARAAEVPIVVAINKIDRENADPNRVMQQLSENGLIPEAWGGDTVVVEISALQNLGIDELLDNINVVAELEDLRATLKGRARGVVLEANLDVGRGPVATVLVQTGCLKVGDPLVAGPAWGRVRALLDDRGEGVKEAGPSTPVRVLGLSEVAEAGDDFVVAPDDRTARRVGETRGQYARLRDRAEDASPIKAGVRLEDVFASIQKGEAATLNLVLKADVTGSLEALTEALRKLERDEVKIAFVLRGVGGITKDDIQLASATGATIIGFNVRPDRRSRELAETEAVEIRTYEVIYNVLEDIERAMVGMLAPEYVEVVTGDAEVREIFRVPRVGAIAGCYVLNGTITRGSKVRFLREGVIIWKGSIQSLRRFKDDVREVQAGFECGIGLSDFQDLKQGDVIETFEEREVPRT
jgi:translation initiation factor IF-2